MDMASNDIRLETKNGQLIAMNLHSCGKEIFIAADLVLIENFATKILMSIFQKLTINVDEYG